MFQFRRFPTYTYLIQCTLHGYCPCGFPHSEISGSMDICSSPKLIAAYRVLHRLSVPRHSPCALFSLTNRKHRFRFVLFCELCRHSQILWNCNCYPHLFRCCSTIKIYVCFPYSRMKTSLLPYFTCFQYIVQFSRCKKLFPTAVAVRFESLIS